MEEEEKEQTLFIYIDFTRNTVPHASPIIQSNDPPGMKQAELTATFRPSRMIAAVFDRSI
jgi:hypothetical protein